MKAVFPGRPQAKLQAVTTVQWADRRITAYIAGASLIVLGAPNELIQSISLDNDAHFTAVSLDEATGKIAASTDGVVYVYQPFGQDVGALKWSLQQSLTPSSNDKTINSLSWGLPHELLVAGASLTLFSTGWTIRELSTRKLANRAKFAKFSHDASLIASTGQHDRLVKIWKRLFYGGDNARFDVSYLPHPATVTHLRWRGHPGPEEHCDPVLYTLCADHKLRIWTATDSHGLQALQLWSFLDLGIVLQPRVPLGPDEVMKRYVFYIDSWDFKTAVTRATSCEITGEREKHALDHLKELASENPEVCVILDGQGNMSAWGLEHVGCKERRAQDVVNIAHAEGLDLDFAIGTTPEEDYVQMYSFLSAEDDSHLCLLAEFFDGRLQWLECPLHQFFNPILQGNRLKSRARLTGHEHAIDAIHSVAEGNAVISIASHGDVVVWSREQGSTAGLLDRHSIINTDEAVLHALFTPERRLVVLISARSITLWDTHNSRAAELAKRDYHCNGTPCSLMWLHGADRDQGALGVALITSTGECIAWHVASEEGSSSAYITELVPSLLDAPEDFSFCQSVSSTSCGPNYGTQDELLSCDASGRIIIWSCSVSVNVDSLQWTRQMNHDSQVAEPFVVRAGPNKLVAMVNSKRTTVDIWNVALACLEYTLQLEDHEEVYEVAWTTNPSGYALLAISLRQKTMIYAQSRYGSDGQAPWVQISDINIAGLVNVNIAASAWLSGGDFLLAAGQQLFQYSDQLELPDTLMHTLRLPRKRQYHTSEIVNLVNGPLPLYHPTILAQCLLSGNLHFLYTILSRLKTHLKYYTTGEELDSFLKIDLVSALEGISVSDDEVKPDYSRLNYADGDGDSTATFSEEMAVSIIERLSDVKLPHTRRDDQEKLSSLIKKAGLISRQQGSVDDFATLYLAELPEVSTTDETNNTTSSNSSPWRRICWAYHSNSEEILIDLTSRQYNGRILWQNARDSGMFMWMTDLVALRAQFEVVARNEYTKTDEKNPVDCTLYYLALRKKQVLSGLWRMASWHREQGATQRLLANNFSDARWKTAALKNAYALLGKRRYEYAASFFLLADNLQGAVGVLASQLGDVQLAIAVARVYEGDDGPVLRGLLENKVLPKAAEDGDEWLGSWAFWMLGQKELALQALTTPLHTLIPRTPPLKAVQRHLSTQDPSLVVFYKQLRNTATKESRTVIQTESKAEWDLVIRSAKLYLRMGCDVLALDLVRNWEFLAPVSQSRETLPQTNGTPSYEEEVGTRAEEAATKTKSMLDDIVVPAVSNGATSKKKVFEEPSASSIFDNFDF